MIIIYLLWNIFHCQGRQEFLLVLYLVLDLLLVEL